MKIIEPSFHIETPFGPLTHEVGQKLLVFIERQARISHRSEDLQNDNSWQRFIEAVVIQHGDWSVVEHSSLTVVFRVDRGAAIEIRTHRLASYTMESTRFCNYQKKGVLEFICPQELKDDITKRNRWVSACEDAEEAYEDLIKERARPQAARSVLPNSFAATIAMTANLRSIRQFLLMRTTQETHPDLRSVTIPLWADLKSKVPILFNDIEPNMRQVDNLRKPR